MSETFDFVGLVEKAENSIYDCLNMNESVYKEYGLITATLAQACATLALVKLLESMYDSNDIALRVIQLR